MSDLKSPVISALRNFLSAVSVSHRERAVALTAMEVEELENIFALLMVGSFVGLPSPPTFIAVELLPFLERELDMLGRRAEDSCDMLAELCGMLGID